MSHHTTNKGFRSGINVIAGTLFRSAAVNHVAKGVDGQEIARSATLAQAPTLRCRHFEPSAGQSLLFSPAAD